MNVTMSELFDGSKIIAQQTLAGCFYSATFLAACYATQYAAGRVFQGCRGVLRGYRSFQASIPKTPHDAARIGDVSTLRKLLGGKDPDSVDADGMTSLMHATRNGYRSAVYFLLENGADSHLVTTKGETALHLAIADHQTECAEVLVEHNGPINVQDGSGRTPAMCAIDEGDYRIFKNIAEVDTFDHQLVDRRGQTVAHYAAKTQREDVLQSVPCLRELKGVADVDGHTPLDLLCGAGEVSLKEFDALYFSEVFESLEQKERDLCEAYSRLSYHDKAEIREKISEFGDSYLQAIERPLYHTSSKFYPMGVALLKLAFRPPEVKGNPGRLVDRLGPLTKKALFIAVEKRKMAILSKPMRNSDFDPNLENEDRVPLAIHALNHGQVELAEKIASHRDFDPNRTDPLGNTIVHAAARAGAASLIQKFGDLLANDSNRKGQIPLAVAVEEAQATCFHPLVERTHEKKLRSVWREMGLTPIQYAVVTGSEPLRKALNERGIYFEYDGNPEPFFPVFLNQMMAIFSVLEEGLGLKTAELVQLKRETQDFLNGKHMEPSWLFSQLILGLKHFLENAHMETHYRKETEIKGGASFTTFFLRLVREHTLPLVFAGDVKKSLPFLHAAKRNMCENGKKLVRAGLPIDPAFELGQDILRTANPLILDKATPFRILVAENSYPLEEKA